MYGRASKKHRRALVNYDISTQKYEIIGAMDHQTRYRYIGQINTSFTPGAPIDSRELFAGREKQVDRVISIIFQKGSHPVLFGERGVGKTSLTNTIFD